MTKTQPEVSEALEEHGLLQEQQRVQDWYDGFTFGSRRDIYNPWSIINYLDKRQVRTRINASSNGLADKLIHEGSAGIKMARSS